MSDHVLTVLHISPKKSSVQLTGLMKFISSLVNSENALIDFFFHTGKKNLIKTTDKAEKKIFCLTVIILLKETLRESNENG